MNLQLFLIFQLNVTVGGLEGSNPVTCSRQVVIVPDKALTDVSTVTAVV